jgi:cytohesin
MSRFVELADSLIMNVILEFLKNDPKSQLRLLSSSKCFEKIEPVTTLPINQEFRNTKIRSQQLRIQHRLNENLINEVKKFEDDEEINWNKVFDLVEDGADPYICNPPLLLYSLNEETLKLFKLLLKLGVNPNCCDSYLETPLMQVTQKRDIELVKLLLKHGADPNIQNKDGCTALYYCNNYKICELLLKHGADPNIQNKDGCTALYYIDYIEDIDICKLLIKYGIKYGANIIPNLQDKFLGKKTFLMIATESSDIEFVESLLKHGADPNIQDINGSTALMFTHYNIMCKYKENLNIQNDIEIFELLLKHGADPNIRDKSFNQTVLHDVNDINICKLLLKHGADPNIQDENGKTVLHYIKDSDICELLLKHEANPNIQDKDGDTPLILAFQKNEIKCFKLLLEYGADPNIQDNYGQTFLYDVYDINVCELLLKHGADPNIQDKYGRTPLHYYENYKICELLLKHGADPNILDKDGRTPLHDIDDINVCKLLIKCGANIIPNLQDKFLDQKTLLMIATQKNDIEFVESLLKHGADPNIQNKDGYTALHYIVSPIPQYKDGIWQEVYNIEICELLLKHGADPNIQNKNGYTPLHWCENIEMCELLLKYKADPNIRSENDDTPLFNLYDTDNIKLLESLLKHGADPNISDKDGNYLLIFAYNRDDKGLYNLLIKYGADPNILNKMEISNNK